MATVNKQYLRTGRNTFGGAPYGNQQHHHYNLTTNSSGGAVNADSASALQIGDVVRLGILPAGFKLKDSLAIVSDAFTASVTAKLGFAYVDGVDSVAVPQDDDYFNAAIALNAQGRTRANNNAVAPVVLPKDAYVILTIAGANNAAVGIVDIFIEGEDTGAP